jgi:FkbM family methyltransferase
VRRAGAEVGKMISRALDLLIDPAAIRALLTWPEFSLTSYHMVSGLVKQDISPRAIIDGGANVGQFAVAASKLFPDAHVYSIEPLPECFERLRRNTRNLPKVTAFQFALGETDGTVDLHINSHNHSSSLLPLAATHRAAFPDAIETGTVSVKVSTLDSLFAAIDLKPPVLLKLDLQGYEATALRGGTETLKRVQYVVLEASFKQLYEGETLFLDLVRLMEACRFRFSRPVGSLSDPSTGEILQIDALFEQASSIPGPPAPGVSTAMTTRAGHRNRQSDSQAEFAGPIATYNRNAR